MNQSKKQYYGIDLTKFICSILVVMIHFQPTGTAQINHWIQNCFARIAVPFFFLSSGFFLYKKSSPEHFEIQTTFSYIQKLIRLYLIWSVIYLPLTYLKYYHGDGKPLLHHIIDYCRRLLFTGTYFHFWYFPALCLAVLLVSGLLTGKAKPFQIFGISIIFYLIGLAGQSYYGLVRPLLNDAPDLLNFLKILRNIAETTRNGLHDGFLFVAGGMLCAYGKIRISARKSCILFVISMLLFAGEFLLIQRLHWAYANDMYLFLIPTCIFLFLWVSQIMLPESGIYKQLRIMSSLVYYLHLFIGAGISMIYQKIHITNDTVKFLSVLAGTLFFSWLITNLSQKEKCKKLCILYTG